MLDSLPIPHGVTQVRPPAATPTPDTSFLGAYARNGAFTDCYALTVPASVSLADFVEAFYTTRLFKLERWILGKVLRVVDSDQQAAQLAQAGTDRFCAWRVEQRAVDQILMDAGQTRSWLSVVSASDDAAATTLLFGSAVLPLRDASHTDRFGLAFHLLLGFHRWYSKALLVAAAKRVMAFKRDGHAAC